MPPIYINGQEVIKRYVGISEVVAAYVGSQQVFSSSLDPAVIALFSPTDQGVMIDFSDAAVLYQDNAGSTPVTDYGQVIGKVSDKSGKNNHATQATSANRAIMRGMPRTLGADIVLTGNFSSDANWTKGAGWSIGSGVATKAAGTGSDLSQSLTLTAGASYVVFFNITRTAGSLTPKFTGGSSYTGVPISASGCYSEVFTATTGNNAIAFSGDAAFAGTVDNVVVKPVSSFVNPGAFFDGSNDNIKTAAINLSSSDKATLCVSCSFDYPTAAKVIAELGNWLGGDAGSIKLYCQTNPVLAIKGDTTQVYVTSPAAEGSDGGVFPLVLICEIDISQATTALELMLRTRGIIPTLTPNGASAGAGSLANAEFAIGSASNGSAPWRGLINKVLLINRALVPDELAVAHAWVKQSMAYCAVIGDSTVAYNGAITSLPTVFSVASHVGGMVTGAAGVANSGDKIGDQKTKWLAIPDKSALQAVFIQAGLNDINTWAGTKTSAQIIADLQDLIDTVNSGKPAGCKTYVSGLTPCKQWIGVGVGQAATAYQIWLDVNEAISGGGATPITGVDGVITGHVAALNDGAGNLLPNYQNTLADGVHPNAQGKFIIGQYWRAQLETDRLV